MVEINNIDDNRISVFRSLKQIEPKSTSSGLFIAEGLKTCLQLLKSRITIMSVFALEKYYTELNDQIQNHSIDDNQKFYTSKEIMNRIVGFRIHSGIMMLAEAPGNIEIGNLGNKIIVLNGIIDSENVGSIIRNCAAFGFGSVIADESASSPYLRRAVRVSMGTVFFTKIHYSKLIIETLRELKYNGFTVIGAETGKWSVSLEGFTFPEKFVLVFGTESKGISLAVLDMCDVLIHIPVNQIGRASCRERV